MRGLTDISRRTNVCNGERPGKGIDALCHVMVRTCMNSVADPYHGSGPGSGFSLQCESGSSSMLCVCKHWGKELPRLITWASMAPLWASMAPGWASKAPRNSLWCDPDTGPAFHFDAKPNPASFWCGSEFSFLNWCGSATMPRLNLSWYLHIYKRQIVDYLKWCMNLTTNCILVTAPII